MTFPRWFVPLAAILYTFPFPINLAAQSTPKAESRDYSKEPYVVERVVNKVTFENNGTYTEETEIRVRVQSVSGVQNWGLIRLPYASSLGDAEIADVEVTKTDGTVVTTPLGGIQDIPAQITIAAPFYSDLKEKDLAVKGLDSGDVLQYREIFHARSPLIPGQFWFDHNFFTQGIVLSNELQISVPRGRSVTIRSPKVPPSEMDENEYHVYAWKTENLEAGSDGNRPEKEKSAGQNGSAAPFADVELTSFQSWDEIAQWYRQLIDSRLLVTPEIQAKADELTRGATTEDEKIRALYGYVSTKVRYIGVALGIGRYQPHSAVDVLSNGYGDCKDKHTLLAALLAAEKIKSYPALINSSRKTGQDVPTPSHFDHMVTVVPQGKTLLWLDTTPEVGPFGYLTSNLRDNQALIIPDSGPAELVKTPADPPFPSLFRFQITGKIGEDGTLEAKTEATVRGDVEVALRGAFRRTPQPQWKDVVQAISRLWNFAGTVSDVTVSTPEATDNAFSFKYGYTRKDYPDWPDVIRPPLPPVNLAQLPEDTDKSGDPIPLESPGEYIMDAKVELPSDLRPRLHAAVDIKKDFAEYHSSYSMDSNVLHSERHLIIYMREISRNRSDEYRAFSEAVSDDSDSFLSLSRSATPPSADKKNPTPRQVIADQNSEKLVDLGDALFNQGDLDGAMAEYHKALELDPHDLRALRSLGDALLNKSDYSGAASQYQEVLRRGSNDPLVHHGLGEALYNQLDLDGAIAEYREALRLKPDYTEAHSDIGLALSAKHDLAGAIAEFRQALRLKPDYPDAHSGLAAALLDKDDLDGAIAEYREALRLKPDYPYAHTSLGDALLRKNDVDAAILEFREAIRQDSNYEPAHYSLGEILVRRGQTEEGIDELKKAITVAPEDPQAYQILATAYTYLHRYEEALGVWKQMEKISPGAVNAARAIAMILIEEKRYAEAIAEVQPAAEKNPNAAPLAFTLGMAFARSGDGDRAIAAFQKALELDSSSAELNAVGYELADANVGLDDALRYSEQAVEQQETATATIDLQALTRADLRKMPALAAYWDTLGWTYFRLGHVEEAEKYLNAAWKLAQIPDIGDHLGHLYEKAGDKRKAISFYALTLATNHAPRETSAKLETLLGSKAQADEAVSSALGILGQQRTTKLPRFAKGHASAEFFVLFRAGSGIIDVKFIAGSENLRGAAKALASGVYDVTFPDERTVKLVRRGILDCPETGPSCQFILLPPETVNSLN
jgi:tetratricopeptide (TPR) repeat protein